MLQSVRNKQTMDILRKLRQKGMPQPGGIGTVSLDMTLPDDTGEEQPDQNTEEAEPVEPAPPPVEFPGMPQSNRLGRIGNSNRKRSSGRQSPT